MGRPPRRPRRGPALALALVAGVALAACTADDPSGPDGVAGEEDPGGEDDTGGSGEGAGESPETAPPSDPDGDGGGSRAPTEPDLSVSLELTRVASMDSPTAGALGPDDTLYLAERAGTVHPLGADGLGEPVVDLSDETTTDGERGLLGLAFARDGSELYLSFTDAGGDTRLDAVALDDGEVDPGRRRTLLAVEQPYANHNGGDVHVGPDGLLYLGLGDGGDAGDPHGNGQDLSTRLGALLRIDPRSGDDDAVPDDNPFADADGAAGEIYAYGLRNPWRFSFDPATEQLWIADVGQQEREEINVGDLGEVAGANYGWNLMEGTEPYAGSEPEDHVPPVYEYETRGPEGCSVTGGHVYRGAAIPELTGAYVYADLCEGLVRGLVVEDGEVVEQAGLGVAGSRVVSFARDAAGELYLLDFEGSVHRIDPA